MDEKLPLFAQRRVRHGQSHGFRFYGIILAIVLCCRWLFLAGLLEHVLGDRPPSSYQDAHRKAIKLLSKYPLIDTHVDVPIYIREVYANQLDNWDFRQPDATPDVDIPRIKQGKMGGLFWSVYVPCASDLGLADTEGSNFTGSTWRVRDTLEQIDISKLIINRYSDTFVLADSSKAIRQAHSQGKIASLLGVEGAHQLGNSFSTLRQYRELGVRYVTLTHGCNNAFADSCGYSDAPVKPIHGGLSVLGRTLIKEMNRIGMIVDLSHTSDQTVDQALDLSLAPPIFSHSNARAVFDTARNVPDSVLERIANASSFPAGDALISVNAVPYFLNTNVSEASIKDVVSQIEHVASKAGKNHVGIGTDFDGVGPGARTQGFNSVKDYPPLVAELLLRGWKERDIAGLIGGNLMRILDQVDAVAANLQKTEQPATALYRLRPDLPANRQIM